MKDEIFYIYLDKTDDGRVFYVGKGKSNRLRNTSNRNNCWKGIAAKYGQNREIIIGTRDEEFAFEMEKSLIAEYKTFDAKWPKGEGWGANFTDGGEGQSGRVGELAARYGQSPSVETRVKLSEAFSGTKNHQYGKRGELSPNFGKTRSKEAKIKMINSRLKLIKNDKPNNVSKLKINQILEIRSKYAEDKLTQKEIGK